MLGTGGTLIPGPQKLGTGGTLSLFEDIIGTGASLLFHGKV